MIRKLIGNIFYKESNKKYFLNDILEHAVKNTRYYSNFNSKDLNSFPILTKDIIRENFEDLKSKDLNSRKWWINTSGGSTGEPVKFIQDKEYLEISRIITYKQKQKVGYKFGQSLIKLWGDEREVLNGSQSLKSKFINHIKNLTFLNSFNMTEQNMYSFIEQINQKQPKLIVAYAQAMYELSKFVEEKNIKIESVDSIITSAGTLYPFMKESIEKNFNTKVFNRYGSREVGNIACEEPNIEGLVITNGVYVEIVDENGNICEDGVEGEILITSLINYAMPLIRYKIGDRGILNTAKYNFPILEKVSGRNVNMFRKSDGTLIDGEYFTHLLYHIYWINKFQIVQKDYKYVVINIVLNNNKIDKDIDDIKKGIYKVLGKDCTIEFNYLDEILPLKSGKYLYTICELNK